MTLTFSIPFEFNSVELSRQFALVARAGGEAGVETGTMFGSAFAKELERLPAGMSRIREQLATELSPAMEVLREGGQQAISSLRRAFSEFVRTGEVDFDRLVRSMIHSLAMIAFDEFIANPLRDLLRTVLQSATGGGASGGGASLLSSVAGFLAGGRALGGPVSVGRPYVVGERGRELFVPHSSGTIVPHHAMGTGQIVFNVNATDAQSFQRSETQIAAMLNRMVRRGQRNL